MIETIRILLMGLVFSSIALSSVYADIIGSSGCLQLNQNETWMELLPQMADDIAMERYQEAEKKALILNKICSQSPMLNYMKGKLAEAQKDVFHARMYYQMASENTYEMATSAETAKKIWYARYEFEYPDRTEAAVMKLNETIDGQKAEIKSLNETADALKREIAENREKYRFEQHEKLSEQAEKAMWTGAGIGLGGIAVMATGLGLLASGDIVVSGTTSVGDSNFRTNKVSSKYQAGLSLTGIGAGMAIVGAVVTGIYGYEFMHHKKEINISASVTSLTFSMKF